MQRQISKTTNDASRTMITKWVAYAFKSRVCLFEGTFRKYNTQLNLAGSANSFLNMAVAAAKEVMDKSGFKLYEGAGAAQSYRRLFTSVAPVPCCRPTGLRGLPTSTYRPPSTGCRTRNAWRMTTLERLPGWQIFRGNGRKRTIYIPFPSPTWWTTRPWDKTPAGKPGTIFIFNI